MVKVRRAQIMRGTEQRSSTKLGPHLECGDLSPLLWLADVSARQGAFGARRTSSGEAFVAIRRRQVAGRNMACEEAGKALTYAIIGIFCFGFVFGSMAISKGLEARRLIREDPRLTGEAKANVALILGTMVLILWVLGMIGRAKRRL